jgi:hypothetical protein
MRSYAFTLALCAALCTARAGLQQDKGTGFINGAVYDLYETVVPNVHISVENASTGEVSNFRTDDSGRYRAMVQPGRYRVVMRSSVGYPIGYEHSIFTIASGEKITINFRPKPFAISSYIEGGRWAERYVGALPTLTTHFVQQRDGSLRDVQIQCQEVRSHNDLIEYRSSVIASFDRFTIYANRITFHPKTPRLIADGDVILEDGERVQKTTRIELNLRATPPVVTWR